MLREISKFDNGLTLMYHDGCNQYCLSDGWLTDWIVFYPSQCSQSFGLDGLFEYSHGISGEIHLKLNTIRQSMIINGHLE